MNVPQPRSQRLEGGWRIDLFDVHVIEIGENPDAIQPANLEELAGIAHPVEHVCLVTIERFVEQRLAELLRPRAGKPERSSAGPTPEDLNFRPFRFQNGEVTRTASEALAIAAAARVPVLLWGAPGTGKSWVAQAVARFLTSAPA